MAESYRSPPAIEALARGLFEDLPNVVVPRDPALAFTEVGHELEQVSLLIPGEITRREDAPACVRFLMDQRFLNPGSATHQHAIDLPGLVIPPH